MAEVKADLGRLQSNTSRLEGEKEGLEKVLKVKEDIVEQVSVFLLNKTHKM